MHKVVTTNPEEAPAGMACANIVEGNGSSTMGQTTDDFWSREETTPAGASLKIGSFDEVLVERFYDRSFIANHEVDRFVVTTRGGDQYAYVYWGGDSCESCPPGPFEPLPGDPWGCGANPAEGDGLPDEGGEGPAPAVDAR
jgi:hypothetical protein